MARTHQALFGRTCPGYESRPAVSTERDPATGRGDEPFDGLPLVPWREMRVALHHAERLPPTEFLIARRSTSSIARREAKEWRAIVRGDVPTHRALSPYP